MNMKNDLVKNITKLNDWKKEQSLSRYLNVLSFHDLMNESTSIINEIIKNKTISDDLSMKSKLLTNEIGDRIDNSSGKTNETFRSLKKSIEEALHKLNHKLF